MSYSVGFCNKGIGVDVNFGQGDAISVPVNINSLDTDKVADRLAEKLQFPEIDTTELAKQGDNPEATNSKIYDAVKGIPDLSLLYAARAEKNDDGVNTYSIVLPVTAKVTYDDNGVATIQL
jgi:hypothetical protein